MIERPPRRISATTKFYVAFVIVVVLVIALSSYLGYRAGVAHGRAIVSERAHDSS
jgi:hypothetical protein